MYNIWFAWGLRTQSHVLHSLDLDNFGNLGRSEQDKSVNKYTPMFTSITLLLTVRNRMGLTFRTAPTGHAVSWCVSTLHPSWRTSPHTRNIETASHPRRCAGSGVLSVCPCWCRCSYIGCNRKFRISCLVEDAFSDNACGDSPASRTPCHIQCSWTQFDLVVFQCALFLCASSGHRVVHKICHILCTNTTGSLPLLT